MVGDPRDRTAYAIAIAGLGLALAVLLAGICWLAIQHGTGTDILSQKCALHPLAHCRPELSIHHGTPYIPQGLWIALVALGSFFAGTLIPFPLPFSPVIFGSAPEKWWLWNTLRIVALLLVLGAAASIVHVIHDSLARYAAAGLLLGLLAPSPGRGD